MAYVPKGSRPSPWHNTRRKPGERVNREPRYSSKRWRTMRALYLREHPLCIDCNELAHVVDHITPVTMGGDFWNGPFQPMCDSCHARKSRLERRDLGDRG